MKRFALFIVMFLAGLSCFGQMKISDYPNTNNASPTDLLLLSVPGVTNRNIKIVDFKANVVGSMGTNTMVVANFYTTNLYSTNLYATYIYTTNINANTIYTTNIYATNSYTFNSYSSNIITTNLSVKYVYSTNIYVTNLYVSYGDVINMTVTSNLYVNNHYTTNLTVQSNVTVKGNVYISQTNFNNYLVVSNLSDFKSNITVAGSAQLDSLTVTNGIFQTNRTITIATNTTSLTLDFSGKKDWYDVPTLMETNLVLSPTNLMAGREIWVFFTAGNGNFDVTITNTAETAIHWNLNSTTNGSTSFTVTNGQGAELSIVCRSNNVLHAVYGHYR